MLDAGLVDTVGSNHAISDEVRLISTPGHTAGHVSVETASAGERAVITGDRIHHPCQLAHPEWTTAGDLSTPNRPSVPAGRLLSALAHDQALLIGTHFAGPTAGRVLRDGESFRLRIDD
ncbi:hypothetical protein ACIA47_14990 [Micromonospora sp. NPDC051227]|uniref:hypothetical protein n=1 Tax=Micromonospora sp. NPDC051227 TaxID=3364285 RepID=UPI0037BD7CBA